MASKEVRQPRDRRAGPRPAKPEASKSLLEVLVVPVTLALITAAVAFTGTRISSSVQQAADERSFRSTQVAAVEKLAAAVGTGQDGEMEKLAPRLIAYEQFAIPVFFGALQREDLGAQDRRVVERSLVHVGGVSGHVEEVGSAMLQILQDPWRLYGYKAHESALRVVSSICFRGAEQTLAAYAPETSVKGWVDVRSVPEEVECLDEVDTKECFFIRLGRARQRLASQTCGSRGSPGWGFRLGR